MANKSQIRANLTPAELYEEAVRRGEAAIMATGALSALTGQHTGRSPRDKFLVEAPRLAEIWWSGNRAISEAGFNRLFAKMVDYLASHEVYEQDVYACADPRHP